VTQLELWKSVFQLKTEADFWFYVIIISLYSFAIYEWLQVFGFIERK
jgi:hypothetical protein